MSLNKEAQYMEQVLKQLIPEYGEMAINLKLKNAIIDDLSVEKELLIKRINELEEENLQLKHAEKTLQQLIHYQQGSEFHD